MPSNGNMNHMDHDLMSLFFFVSAVSLVVKIGEMTKRHARRIAGRRARAEFWEMTSVLTDDDFQRTFRMTRCAFKKLCSICRPHISPRYWKEEDADRERISHTAGRDIQTEVKVAIFLRTMAGGSFLDIHMLFGIGRSSVFRIFRKMLAIVLNQLPWESFPDTGDLNGFRDMAMGFALSRSALNPLPGCIAALDGLQVPIVSPSRDQNPLHYFSRKGYFTIPVQALVNANYRFIACSILAVGSTHDNVALMLSDMYSYFQSGNVPTGFWVAGDEAYTCTETLLIPFAKGIASPVHDGYNFFHSSHRVHVEQAFGILKRRWGILQKPLAFDIALATKIVPAAMKLHNYCINEDCGVPKPSHTRMESRLAEERLESWINWCQDGFDLDDDITFEIEEMSASARRAENKSETRRKLVKIVRRECLKRPELNFSNEVHPSFPFV